MKLVNIDAAVAEVAKADKGDRTKIVDEYLRGVCAIETTGGKAVLQRRALFVTELRVKRVWPNV